MVSTGKLIKILLLGILFFGCIPVRAQEQVVPKLMARSDADAYRSLKLLNCSIEVEFIGKKAITTLEMDFFNEADEQAEGVFLFPLRRDQALRHFAVTVDEVLREAVVVENTWLSTPQHSLPVPRASFNGVPGATAENFFSYTIKSIPAKGTKKIVLSYQQEMPMTAEGFAYQLPISFIGEIRKFNLKLMGSHQQPVLKGNMYRQITFGQENGIFIGRFAATDIVPQGLNCTIPVTETDVFTGRSRQNNRYYFYGQVRPEVETVKKSAPKKVVLLWDESSSVKQKQIDKEIELLDAYFSKLYTLDLQLITFNSQLRANKKISVQNGNWREIKEFIANLNYDGGTQLGSIDLSKYEADEFILSSDGITSFGSSEIKSGRAPIICLNSNPHADTTYLNYLADHSGGQYINLNRLDRTAALAQLFTAPYQFISAQYDPDEVTAVYPSGAVNVDRNFAFSGVLLKEKAKIRLNFGYRNHVKYSKEIELSRSAISNGFRMESLWADMKLAELTQQRNANHSEIIALSKQYNIPVEGTSFVVPDDFEQYLAYRIEPPKEFFIKYQNYVAQKKKEEAGSGEAEQASRIIDVYTQRKNWYDREFVGNKAEEADLARIDYVDEGDRSNTLWNSEPSDSSGFTLEDMPLTQEQAQPSAPVAALPAVALFTPGMTEARREPAETTEVSWSEEEDYLKILQQADRKKRYEVYLVLKEKYEHNAGFYADVANLFYEQNDRNTAVLVLSNIAELKRNDARLLRLLANRLMKMEQAELALPLLERVLAMYGNDPQSYRDLGLCYAALGKDQQAIDLLNEVLTRRWDRNYESLQEIVLGEINHILAASKQPLNIGNLPAELREPMPVDIRVLVEWDNPEYDMDLWVIDPKDDKAYYGNALTQSGGKLTADMTANGYSPEEFIVRKALPGNYNIKINHYGSKSDKMFSPSLVTVTIFTNYGRPNEQKKQVTLRLTDKKDVVDAATFSFSGDQAAQLQEIRYQTITSADPVYSVAFSPDNKLIAAAHEYDVKIYEAQTGKLLKVIQDVNIGGIVFKKLVFNAQGSQMLLLGDSTLIPEESIKDINSEDFWEDTWYEEGYISVVKLLDVQKGICLRTYIAADTTLIAEISFLADGKSFIAMTAKGASKVDLSTGVNTPTAIRPEKQFISFATTMNRIATSEHNQITIIDATNFRMLNRLQADSATGLKMSDNGNVLSYVSLSGGKEQLTIVDLATGKKISSFDHYYQTGISRIGLFVLSPDGRYIASQPRGTNQVTIKTTATADDILTYYHEGEVTDIRFSADGKLLTSASKDNTIRTRRMNRLPFGSIKAEGNAFDFDVDRKGVTLALAEENNILLFRRQNRKEQRFSQQVQLKDTTHIQPIHRASDVCLSTGKNHQFLLYIDNKSYQNTIVEVPIGNQRTDVQPILEDWTHNYKFKRPGVLKVSPGGRYVAFDEDTLIKILDVDMLVSGKKSGHQDLQYLYTQKSIRTLSGHRGDPDRLHLERAQETATLRGMDFSPNSKYLVSRGVDKTIRVWEVASGRCLAVYSGKYDASPQVKFSDDSHYVLFEDAEYTVKVWDWKENRIVGELKGHQARVNSIEVSDNGRYILTASSDDTIRLWNAKDFSCTRVYYDNAPRKVMFCDKNTFISAGEDTYLKFWKIR